MKKKTIILLILLAVFTSVRAHNPLSAMYYLEVKEDINILNISLSQNGLNEALKKHFSNLNLETLSAADYKQKAIGYIKDNFSLIVNGVTIKLLEGGIKLGNHETDLKFIIDLFPKHINTLDVHIDAFKENNQHQSVFSILIDNKTSRVILNKENNYKVALEFSDNKAILKKEKINKSYLFVLFLIPVVIVTNKYIKKSNQNETQS